MSSIMTAIYGGGPFYTGGSAVIDDLKASGFTTVVAWSVHVSTDGDLVLNDTTIVSGGAYVGNPEWPDLLAELKQGTTSVNRLLFSVGSGATPDFANIQALIQDTGPGGGRGPGSFLYDNFQALKAAIPTIDGIDFDDEDLWDQNTIVEFAQMLGVLGYSVTFCPFNEPSFWAGCLAEIAEELPTLVTGFNLQCYSGGSYNRNHVQDWIGAITEAMGPEFPAASFVFPGLWCRNEEGEDPGGDCPNAVQTQFSAWQSSLGTQGGFIWLYDHIQKYKDSALCGPGVPLGTAAYAGAVRQGLQPQAAGKRSRRSRPIKPAPGRGAKAAG